MAVYRDADFVHLHVHSSYSLLEGALRIADLARLAADDRMPALALTDTNNLFGALEFSEKMAATGVQPIAGLQLSVDFGDRQAAHGRALPGAADPARANLVLLAQSEAGFENLSRLSSSAFMETAPQDHPHVSLAALARHAEGLIALTGGPSGPLDSALQAGLIDLAATRLQALRELFTGRLYVELQRHGIAEARAIEPALIDLAYANAVPLAGANEAYFATAGNHAAHDALLAIAEGRTLGEANRRQCSPEHWLKPRAEMRKLFHDVPEAAANTVEIAMRCAYRPRPRKPILPRFTPEGGLAAEALELRRQAEAGLAQRMQERPLAPGLAAEDYVKRLDFELGMIETMEFPGYFLIVADFIQWAKRRGIPVGPGRGSGAGSLVAYSLTITDLDPLKFNLLFERFLNPARVSMPDFDIDFCQERRDEVIRYVVGRYGADRVAQIITFGTLQARGVLRDVGRVMQIPYGQVDKLTKLVPVNPAKPVTLAQALSEEPKLAAAGRDDEMVGRMLEVAQQLEGLHRHASTHAAGIVIGDQPLENLVPLYRDPKSDMRVTQYSMKWAESAGLVKFDFLGLKTLSVLQLAAQLVARRGITVDLGNLPLDDKASYEMLSRGEVTGVFQVESQGMRRALLEMKPDRIEDIIALVALYRPGPMANIPVYCARKHGHELPEYIHPLIKPVLEETYGVIIYQEQVQLIAQIMAGYSLGEADLLRRAMGKKERKEMDAQRERFVSGAAARGVHQSRADEIFDLLAKFADYGFNKSHAAAYAIVSYQTAYMKAHYPVEFLAASMTFDMANTDKLVEFRLEAQRLGITVVPPDINRSTEQFDVAERTIYYSLAALKGVGAEAVKSICAARGPKPFKSLADFARRIDPRQVSKRVIEALAASGALDGLAPNRAAVFAGADMVISAAGAAQEARSGGQAMLFGGGDDDQAVPLPKLKDWPQAERLQREFAAVGFFLSGHPLDEFAEALQRLRLQPHAEFARAVRQGQSAGRLAATVLERQERRTRTGNKMGIITLSDQTGQFEAVIFSEGLAQYRDMLEPGNRVLVEAVAAVENDELRIRLNRVDLLDEALARVQKGIRIFVRDAAPVEAIAARLGKRGDGEVMVVVMTEGGAGEVELRLPHRYELSPPMIGALKAVGGVVSVQHV